MGRPVPASAPEPSGDSSGAARGVEKTAAIAAQHLGVGEQVVAQRDHLGALQVRVAGQQRGGVLARAPAQRQPTRGRSPAAMSTQARRAYSLQVGGHLIVAAARGVQSPAGLADDLDQSRLDVHVDVLERGLAARARPTRISWATCSRPATIRVGVRGGDEADRGQHAGVRLTAADVVAQQPAIEVDAGIQRRRRRVHRPAKRAPRPPGGPAAGVAEGPVEAAEGGWPGGLVIESGRTRTPSWRALSDAVKRQDLTRLRPVAGCVVRPVALRHADFIPPVACRTSGQRCFATPSTLRPRVVVAVADVRYDRKASATDWLQKEERTHG